MDDPQYINTINQYYKLKSDYEKQIKNEINKITSVDSISKQDKRTRFKKFKPKCINCKKPVGTAFSNKNQVLKAVCGDSVNPCKLNIEIDKGHYVNTRGFNDILTQAKNICETDIIKNKLNLLFGYVDEEKSLEIFKSNMEDIKQYNNNLSMIKKTLINPFSIKKYRLSE